MAYRSQLDSIKGGFAGGGSVPFKRFYLKSNRGKKMVCESVRRRQSLVVLLPNGKVMHFEKVRIAVCNKVRR